MRISSITKNAGKACNNRLYRHIRTFEKIVKNYFVILMKFVYTSDKDDEIVKHEKIMLEKCSNILDSYRAIFKEYNCSLEVGYGWENFLKKEHSTNRLPFKNGYECYIYCEVQKDGTEVRIGSNDGEVDYYVLSVSWTVSSIERRFFKLNVSLSSDTDDIENDMNELFQLLSNGK